MRDKYIDAKTFQEFCCNQNTLIQVLNHRTDTLQVTLSTIQNDVEWIKKIMWGIFGVTALALITITIKSAFGN